MSFNIKKFTELVPDEMVRLYILEDLFGIDGKDPFMTKSNYFVVFNNIINLAFIYSFSCIKTLANTFDTQSKKTKLDKCFEDGNSNSKRVIRTLQQVYSKYYVSNELIQFVLRDIYFDFALGADSLLKNHIPNFFSVVDDVFLDEYFSIIKSLQYIDRLENYSFNKVEEMLYRLLKMFNFLKYVKLSYSSTMGCYEFTFYEECTDFRNVHIKTFGLIQRICTDKHSRFFYLSAIEANGKYIYKKTDGKRTAIYYASPESTYDAQADEIKDSTYLPYDNETLLSYLQPDLLKEKKAISAVKLEQLFNINYKYIKNLALALSDTLGIEAYSGVLEALTAKYKTQYPSFWSDGSDGERNWDVIILMLLMEAGPSEVLTTILSSQNVGYRIIANLKKRLGSVFAKRVESITNNQTFMQMARNRVQIANKESMPEDFYNTYEKKVVVQAGVRIILDALSNLDDVSNRNIVSHVSIVKSIQCVKNLLKNPDNSKKCYHLKVLLRDVLERLLCFYAGIIGCAYEKICYDNESENTVLPAERIKNCQGGIQGKFILSAENELIKIRKANMTIKELFDYFFDTCMLFDSNNDQSYKQIFNLKAVLGRSRILDVKLFKESCGIVELPEIDEANIDEWLKMSVKALCFLKIGDGNMTDNPNMLKSVYPIIATYSMMNNNRDGCQTEIFSLEVDADSNGVPDCPIEVRVLSEFDYTISEKYYCLPNIERSTNEWWFDPLVISCKAFDDIFERS